MRSPQRFLPTTWQGPSREARWRRSRGRRLLAGLLGGCAVLGVVGAVRPADPPSYAVTVAAHDLAAGQRLGAADVRQVRWAATDRLPGLLSSTAATGKVLTAPIRAGEPVTSARVRAARSWPSLPAGRVVIGVSTSDRALVRVLQPGDRVDLIDTGRARTVATAVSVVSVPGGSVGATDERPTWSSTDAASVLVALTPTQAAAVGSAASAASGGLGGGIQLALRAGA